MLKEKLGKKRVLRSGDQRRRLAVKGKALGRKALAEIARFPLFLTNRVQRNRYRDVSTAPIARFFGWLLRLGLESF